MEQLESQLPAAEITLSPDVLDRIDALVTPGVTINPETGVVDQEREGQLDHRQSGFLGEQCSMPSR